MTALQLILLNSIVVGGFAVLAYLMSHGDKDKKNKNGRLKHHH